MTTFDRTGDVLVAASAASPDGTSIIGSPSRSDATGRRVSDRSAWTREPAQFI
jgi:hypothetical protein